MELLEMTYRWPNPEIEAHYNKLKTMLDERNDALIGILNGEDKPSAMIKPYSDPVAKHRAYMDDPVRNMLIDQMAKALVFRLPVMIVSLTEEEHASEQWKNAPVADFTLEDLIHGQEEIV